MKKTNTNGILYRILKTKVLIVMKLTAFFFFVSTFALIASGTYSQNKTITINQENALIKDILKEIEDQSGYFFIYNNEFIDVYRKIDIHVKDQTIGRLLDEIFQGQNVDYSINERRVILSPLNVINQLQQNKSIGGKVTDSSGIPLPGVTVLIKGTTQGIITDIDGNYSLSNVPADAILVFSFVGMKSQEIPVAGKSNINVTMSEESIGIDEVVAIGYGTMKKSDLTGSVTSVKAESFIDQPASSINSVLSGRAPGVTVRSNNGAPGQSSIIRIRGANSLRGDNNPLIVVDGNYGGLPNLYDIESIEILKDASATAIYGSRGANGVILVRTKRGQQDKPTLKVYSDVSINSFPQRYELMDPYDFAEFNKSTGAYPFTNEELASIKANGGTNWQKQILQTGIVQSYKAVLSGGTKNIRCYITPSYSKSTGTIKNTGASSYGLDAKIDMDLSDRVTVQLESNIGYGDNLNPDLASGGDKIMNPLVAAMLWSPTEPVYNEDLTYKRLGIGSSTIMNPLLLTEIIEKNRSSNARGVGNIQIKIIDGLKLDAKGLISYSNGGSRKFTNKQYDAIPSASQSSSESKSWLVNAFLTYSKNFANVHNVSAMVGVEETQSEGQSLSGTAKQLPLESVGWYNLGLAAPNIAVGSGYSNGALRSYFGRLNYDYDSRYYVTMNYRADGSSKFKGDNQFGYFPSFSLAWRLSNEEFMKSQDIFQNLKIRGGWGVTGSQAIDTYATYTTLSSKSFDWGGVTQPGYRPQAGGNPNLKWESTKQMDFGVDFVALDNRLAFTFDYYNKKTEDLLAPVTVPAYNGGGTVISNIGKVENKGFEINVDYYVSRRTSEFSYNVNVNCAINRNKVIDIGEQDIIYGVGYASGIAAVSPFVLMPGEPIGTIYGLKYLGIWQEDEAEEAAKFLQEPGDYKYEDVNGNYSYDTEDKQVIGNTNPSLTWGFNNHFSYKNFDLNILFEGVYGRDIMNWSYMAGTERVDFTQTYNLRVSKDRWTPENPDAEFAKVGNTNRLSPLSSQFVQSGDYVKLRNLSLSYRIPKRVISFANIKLSASAQNIFTLTKYKGLDPEISSTVSGRDYDANSGMDWFAYPNPKSYSFGISIEY